MASAVQELKLQERKEAAAQKIGWWYTVCDWTDYLFDNFLVDILEVTALNNVWYRLGIEIEQLSGEHKANPDAPSPRDWLLLFGPLTALLVGRAAGWLKSLSSDRPAAIERDLLTRLTSLVAEYEKNGFNFNNAEVQSHFQAALKKAIDNIPAEQQAKCRAFFTTLVATAGAGIKGFENKHLDPIVKALFGLGFGANAMAGTGKAVTAVVAVCRKSPEAKESSAVAADLKLAPYSPWWQSVANAATTSYNAWTVFDMLIMAHPVSAIPVMAANGANLALNLGVLWYNSKTCYRSADTTPSLRYAPLPGSATDETAHAACLSTLEEGGDGTSTPLNSSMSMSHGASSSN